MGRNEAYRVPVDRLPQPFVIVQGQGVVFANQDIASALGYTVEEFLRSTGDNFTAFIHPDDRPLLLIRHADRLAGKVVPSVYSLRCLHRDGSILWVDVDVNEMLYCGQPAALVVGTDMTGHRRAQEQLRRNEARMQLALDADGSGIWDLYRGRGEVYVDQRTLTMLGLGSEYGLQTVEAWRAMAHPEDLPRALEALGEYLRGETPGIAVELRLKSADGRYLWMQVRGIVMEQDEAGYPVRIIGTMRDITERKDAEHRLMQYQARLKALASELAKAEERERRRIATVLHDGIGQGLVSCKLMVDADLKAGLTPLSPERLAQMSRILCELIEQTQVLNADLGNPTLYELGLIPALEEWVEDGSLRQSGDLAIGLVDEGMPEIAEQDVRALLFRSVKEIIFNAVKHARAHRVEVMMRGDAERAEVIVTDDGAGFDYEEMRRQTGRKGGFGLFSVRERIEDMGGTFGVDSARGRGTRVRLTIPLCPELAVDGRTDHGEDADLGGGRP